MREIAAFLDRVTGWIAPFRLYLTLGVIAIFAIIAVVQTVRIEGFKVWPVQIEGYKAKAERLEADLRNVRAAQELAKAKARQARLEQEARYRALAEKVDDNARKELDEARRIAERFIAAGGVRPKTAGGDGIGAGAGPQGRSASDPQGAGAEAILDEGTVAVTAEDVLICTTNTIKAEAAREWALGVE